MNCLGAASFQYYKPIPTYVFWNQKSLRVVGINWTKPQESKSPASSPNCPGPEVIAQGKEREPLSIIHSLNKRSVNFFPMPGTERHCSIGTSNLVHKLEELTQVGVTDVFKDDLTRGLWEAKKESRYARPKASLTAPMLSVPAPKSNR